MNHRADQSNSCSLWIKIIPIIITVCALSCQSHPPQPHEYSDNKILFGDGGGFSGFVTTYALYENGQVMIKEHQDSIFHAIGKIKRHTAQQVLSNFYSQGISNIELNKPGNVYYFLEYPGIQDHKIVYDPYARKLPKELEQYIHTLNGLVRKIKSKEITK